MEKSTTVAGVGPAAIVEEAWQQVGVSFERFCLTAGIATLAGMMEGDAARLRSNRPNNPTFVDLDFFGGNPSTIGSENQLSTSTEFICWEEIPITAINADLVTAQATLKPHDRGRPICLLPNVLSPFENLRDA
jgi:hypothetical protein